MQQEKQQTQHTIVSGKKFQTHFILTIKSQNQLYTCKKRKKRNLKKTMTEWVSEWQIKPIKTLSIHFMVNFAKILKNLRKLEIL